MKKHIPEISAHTHTPERAPSEKHDLECDLCGNKWTAALASVTYRARKQGRTVGCPICNKEAHRQHLLTDHHRKADNSKVDDELARIGFKLLEPYTNAKSKHKMQCVCCGSISDNTTVLSRKQMAKKLNQVGCLNCSPNQRQAFRDAQIETHDQLLTFVNVESTFHQERFEETESQLAMICLKLMDDFVSPYQPATVVCMDCGHEQHVIPEVQLRKTGHGCPVCATAKRVDDVVEQRIRHIDNLGGQIVGETDVMLRILYNGHTFSVQKTAVRNLTQLDQFLPSGEPPERVQAVIDRLEQANVKCVEDYVSLTDKHRFICGICGHGKDNDWITTPQVISQAFKRDGSNACPKCSEERKYGDTRRLVIERIQRRGFTIMSDYDGKQTTTQNIKVRRESCGHEFESAPGNILHNDLECPVCNKEAKRLRLLETSRAAHAKWLETASDWRAYRSEVTSLTSIVYDQYIDDIDPDRKPRGIAGTPGAYQLDHIVSVRFCFENMIPAELCGHKDNLQMLPWRDNLVKSDNVDLDNLPHHIKHFMESNNLL